MGVFSSNRPSEKQGKVRKTLAILGKHNPDLLNALSIEGPVTNKEVNPRLPIQTKEFRSAHSSQSSHASYHEHYNFSLSPPNGYQRKQTIKLMQHLLKDE